MMIYGTLAGVAPGEHFCAAPGMPSCVEYVASATDDFGTPLIGEQSEFPVAMDYASALRIYWKPAKLLLRKGSLHSYDGTLYNGTITFGPTIGPIRATSSGSAEKRRELVCGAVAVVSESRRTFLTPSIVLTEFVQGMAMDFGLRALASEKGKPLISQTVYLRQIASSSIYHLNQFFLNASSNGFGPDYEKVGECEVDFTDQTQPPNNYIEKYTFGLYGINTGTETTGEARVKIGYINYPFQSDNPADYEPYFQSMQQEITP
jgi:hypothetical protein